MRVVRAEGHAVTRDDAGTPGDVRPSGPVDPQHTVHRALVRIHTARRAEPDVDQTWRDSAVVLNELALAGFKIVKAVPDAPAAEPAGVVSAAEAEPGGVPTRPPGRPSILRAFRRGI